MFLWRKTVDPRWLAEHEPELVACFGSNLAIIQHAGRKRLLLEVACRSARQADHIAKEYRGCIEKLPFNWLKIYSAVEKERTLKIGNRLVVTRSACLQMDGATGKSHSLEKRNGPATRAHLIIPAGAAFGTGDHPTTAMSLRMLEKITRKMSPRWSLLDLGTGSGIFTLAARCLQAGRVVGIDVDPIAISTARANARRNHVRGTQFRLADVRNWQPLRKFDIIMANLLSELLLHLLPRLIGSLKPGGYVIVSGILRSEEPEMARAMSLNQLEVLETRRRGQWIAVLARPRLRHRSNISSLWAVSGRSFKK